MAKFKKFSNSRTKKNIIEKLLDITQDIFCSFFNQCILILRRNL